MNIYFITFVLFFNLLLAVPLFSQFPKDCSKLLKKEFSVSDIKDKPEEFMADFTTLVFCEFDSIDYQIFMGPNDDLMIFLQLLLSYLPDKEKNKNYKFRDVRDALQEFRKMDEYPKIREIVIARNEIFQRKASILNWEYDKGLLLKMGLKDDDVKGVYAIVKQNQLLSYQEVLRMYTDTLKAREDAIKRATEERKKQMMENNPGMEEWVSGLPAYKDLETGLAKASESSKPALLLFTGYGCVNSRIMESEILLDPEVLNYINTNFVFIVLVVDERSKIEEKDIYYSETLGRNVKYSGDRLLEIEMRDFKADTQPLFIILDSQKNEKARIGYTSKKIDFMGFLKTE